VTTSGSTDFTLNAADVVRFALKKLRVTRSPSAADMSDGIQSLNLMLKTWQMTGPNLWRATEGSVNLVANQAAYTTGDVAKACRIISARFTQSGRDLPMEVMTREEYRDLPYKTTTGIPTQYYFDPQRDGGTLYVWPVIAAIPNAETISFTYQRRFEDIDAIGNSLDIPQEWLETVGYSLAARLVGDYSPAADAVSHGMGIAQVLLQAAHSADREPVVRIEPERRWGR